MTQFEGSAEDLERSQPSLALYRLGQVEQLAQQTAQQLNKLTHDVDRFVTQSNVRGEDKRLFYFQVFQALTTLGALGGLIGVLIHGH